MKEFDQSDQDRLPFADGDGQIFDLVNGLPTDDDLTPLSMLLVPPDLASAFGIPLPDLKSTVDVHLATQKTISSLSIGRDFSSSPPVDLSIKTILPESIPIIPDLEESPPSEISERFLEVVSAEEISVYPSDLHGENPLINQRTLKRPRLVWKPHLHKRFVEAVTHLGAKNAVPKTIMQLMNVDGLSRENVASHLQKYRLYLKRLQEFSDEGSSSSDNGEQLYQQDQRQTMLNPAEIPSMAYAVSPMIPMPVYTIPHSNYQSYGMVMLNGHQRGTPYHEFDDRRFE